MSTGDRRANSRLSSARSAADIVLSVACDALGVRGGDATCATASGCSRTDAEEAGDGDGEDDVGAPVEAVFRGSRPRDGECGGEGSVAMAAVAAAMGSEGTGAGEGVLEAVEDARRAAVAAMDKTRTAGVVAGSTLSIGKRDQQRQKGD